MPIVSYALLVSGAHLIYAERIVIIIMYRGTKAAVMAMGYVSIESNPLNCTYLAVQQRRLQIESEVDRERARGKMGSE